MSEQPMSESVIFDPVLAFITHSVSNSTSEHIQAACRDFYTLVEVNNAKDKLWKAGDSAILPSFVRRRDSSVRSEIDATIGDIVKGIQLLDDADKLPTVAVLVSDLDRIPKARPAEMCSISMVERMGQLEARLISTERRLNDLESGMKDSDAPKDSCSMSYSGAVTKETSTTQSVYRKPKKSDIPTNLQVKLPALSNLKSTTHISGSHTSLASDISKPSLYSEGFEYPASHKRKRNNLKRKVVVKGTQKSCSLKGAPEPSRDIFVYRVQKDTADSEITDYVKDQNISIRSIEKMSNTESKFDSFRLEVSVSDMYRLFEPNFWPEGICVRKFFRPKQKVTDDGEF